MIMKTLTSTWLAVHAQMASRNSSSHKYDSSSAFDENNNISSGSTSAGVCATGEYGLPKNDSFGALDIAIGSGVALDAMESEERGGLIGSSNNNNR